MPTADDGTVYSAIAREDGTYVVEIMKPEEIRRFETGFKTKVQAEQWIYDRVTGKSRIAPYAGPPDSLPGHSPA